MVQAAELVRKRVLRHEDILILEREDNYGGVWTAAKYVSMESVRVTKIDVERLIFEAGSRMRCVQHPLPGQLVQKSP